MDGTVSRRDVLSVGLPAAALVGAGLAAFPAWAQNTQPGGGAKPSQPPRPAAPPAGQPQKPPGGPGFTPPQPAPPPIAKRSGELAPGTWVKSMMDEAHQDGKYTLPPLPYAPEALEPHIDAKTMSLHHDKHHMAYVEGLNKALWMLSDVRMANDPDPARIEGLQRDVTFNGGGHMLHTLFWATMGPGAGGEPAGALAEAINKHFRGFKPLQRYFSRMAQGIKGSGWALLAWEPRADQLITLTLNEHDQRYIAGIYPLLPLDVWEHAYYLKYENDRAQYINAWWNVVNWTEVGAAYELARTHAGAGPA